MPSRVFGGRVEPGTIRFTYWPLARPFLQSLDLAPVYERLNREFSQQFRTYLEGYFIGDVHMGARVWLQDGLTADWHSPQDLRALRRIRLNGIQGEIVDYNTLPPRYTVRFPSGNLEVAPDEVTTASPKYLEQGLRVQIFPLHLADYFDAKSRKDWVLIEGLSHIEREGRVGTIAEVNLNDAEGFFYRVAFDGVFPDVWLPRSLILAPQSLKFSESSRVQLTGAAKETTLTWIKQAVDQSWPGLVVELDNSLNPYKVNFRHGGKIYTHWFREVDLTEYRVSFPTVETVTNAVQALSRALSSVSPAPARRPTVGDTIRINDEGREFILGCTSRSKLPTSLLSEDLEIQQDDHDGAPYLVEFSTGTTWWLCESQVTLVEPTETRAAVAHAEGTFDLIGAGVQGFFQAFDFEPTAGERKAALEEEYQEFVNTCAIADEHQGGDICSGCATSLKDEFGDLIFTATSRALGLGLTPDDLAKAVLATLGKNAAKTPETHWVIQNYETRLRKISRR